VDTSLDTLAASNHQAAFELLEATTCLVASAFLEGIIIVRRREVVLTYLFNY
jgi:hypothetical protein